MKKLYSTKIQVVYFTLLVSTVALFLNKISGSEFMGIVLAVVPPFLAVNYGMHRLIGRGEPNE